MLYLSKQTNFLQHASLLASVGLLAIACDSTTSRTSFSQLSTTSDATMKLESSAFSADSMIPLLYTCDGKNTSPPLSWNQPPAGTKSLALIVDDPDAPSGIFTHWMLYDIPPEIGRLPEGVEPQPTLLNGGVQGKNDFGNLGYGGPCPPSGTHRYFFKLYALDRELGLKPGATKAQLEAAMDGHILRASELIGRYSQQR